MESASGKGLKCSGGAANLLSSAQCDGSLTPPPPPSPPPRLIGPTGTKGELEYVCLYQIFRRMFE